MSRPGDTGYTGSWYRESPAPESTLYVRQDGNECRVRLARLARAGVFRPRTLSIDCTHELVLGEDGLGLWSYTLESQGQRYDRAEGGRRHLEKISDEVPGRPGR